MPSGDFCCVAPRRVGANSCPCAFRWLCCLLGQSRLSESFSRGAPRGSLWVRQGPSFRSAFLGRIACPTATTTAAHSRHPRATSTLLAEAAGQRLHLELVLRFLREISPQESISARHKTTKRGRQGQPARVGCDEGASCGPDPAIAASEGSCVLCRLEKSVRANPRCIFIKTAVFAHPNDATGTKRCFGKAGFTRE